MELLSTSQVHQAGKGLHKQAARIPFHLGQAMVESLFSPQPITFTQKDFDLTFAIPVLDPCM